MDDNDNDNNESNNHSRREQPTTNDDDDHKPTWQQEPLTGCSQPIPLFDSASSINDNNNNNKPRIVACGYRHISIPKSGLQFPAFLVAFPPSLSSSPQQQQHQQQKQQQPNLLVWRSKRDFLLLARGMSLSSSEESKQPQQPQQHHFPKGAFRKLSDKVPWKRPELSHAASRIDTSSSYYVGGPNLYHASMKKSLYQIDQFLQHCYKRLAVQEGTRDGGSNGGPAASSSGQDAWEIFSRPRDTEGLVPKPVPLPIAVDDVQACTSSYRPSLSLSRITTNSSSSTTSTTTATTFEQSSLLGQYFCSKDNAKQLVTIVLDYACSYLLPSSSSQSAKKTKLVFVEPGCGHGEVIAALVKELDARSISPNQVTIHGFDIDPNAIATCRQLNWVSSSASGVGDYKVHFTCQDFLQTSSLPWLQQHHHQQQQRANLDGDHEEKMPGDQEDDVVVVCLGSPPYTTGAGSGRDMRRDLPEQFVHHCIMEWKSQMISFILPRRYDGSNLQVPSIDFAEQTIELQAPSQFFFQGSISVMQPSIIKCFSKTRTTTTPPTPESD
jgi:hypothetical protein